MGKILNKKIIGWGASLTYSTCMLRSKIDVAYIVDNNPSKWGMDYEGCRVVSPYNISNEDIDSVFVIVFSMQYEDIRVQLESLGFSWGLNADSFLFIDIFRDLDIEINQEKDFLFLDKIIKPGFTCLDVGANHGIFSKRLSRLVTGTGSVHSFEPQPSAFSGLERIKHEYNLKNLTPYNIALTSDKDIKSVDMVTPTLDGVLCNGMTTIVTGVASEQLKINDNSIVHKLNNNAKIDFDLSKSISVPATTLDVWAIEINIQKFDFIKIDVEGYEFDVLQGASTVLKRYLPLLQIEIAFSYHHHDPFYKISDFLKGYGYECYIVSNVGLSKIDLTAELGQHEHNFYFLANQQ